MYSKTIHTVFIISLINILFLVIVPGAKAETVNSGNLSLSIPNNNSLGVSHTINITDNGDITDLNVILDVDHNHVGELTIELEHGGTSITLIPSSATATEFGCTGHNIVGLVIDDEGTKSVVNDCDPSGDPAYTSVPHKPTGSLSSFNGANINGDWVLTIKDEYTHNNDASTLKGWSLEYERISGATLTLNPANGTELQFNGGNGVVWNVDSPPKSIDFQNEPTDSLVIYSAEITSTFGHADDFELVSPPSFPQTIIVGETYTFKVKCTPSDVGERKATLTFTTNVPSFATITYPLKCIGIAAEYTSSLTGGSEIDFGASDVGTSAGDQSFTITNNSTEVDMSLTATITGSDAGDFSFVSSQPNNLTIAKGGSNNTTITLNCTPSASGLREATLEITTNDPANQTVKYPLKCTGNAPEIKFTPASPNFGTSKPGVSVTKNVKIKNTGNKDLEITAVDITDVTGGGAAAFSFSFTAPFTISVGGEVTPNITCTPPSSPDPLPTDPTVYTATLELAHADSSLTSPIEYTFTCTGTNAVEPLYGSTPPPGAPINMGSSVVGIDTAPKDIKVQEVGNATLEITALEITDDANNEFTVTTYPFNIADNGNDVTVTVKCRPSVGGLRTANLKITTNVTNPSNYSQAIYPLKCTGLAPGYSSTQAVGATLDFGKSPVGEPIELQFKVKEVGTAKLEVNLATPAITGSSDISINSSFPFFISDGGSDQTIKIKCIPTGLGERTARLNLTSNDINNPNPYYDLTCKGKTAVGPGYSSTPFAPGDTIDFGGTPIGASVNKTFDVKQIGSVVLRVNAATPVIQGPGKDNFTVISPNFYFDIEAISTVNPSPAPVTITLQCNPLTVGVHTATLNLTSTDTLLNPSPTYDLTCEGLSPPTPVTPPKPTTPIATYDLSAKLTGTGFGEIKSDPSGINCDNLDTNNDCTESFIRGAFVTFKATAAAGSKFTGWDNEICSNKILVLNDQVCTANFELLNPPILNITTFSLVVAKTGTGSGTVTTQTEGINCGNNCSTGYVFDTLVNLIATPDAGSAFTGWEGDCSTSDSSIKVLMNRDRTCSANFAELPPVVVLPLNYTLTVAKIGKGIVISSQTGIDCGDTCNASYPNNTALSLIATPDTNFNFTGFEGDCDSAGKVVLDADKLCTAAFTPIESNANAGKVQFAQTQFVVGEDATGVTLTVTRTDGNNGEISVDYIGDDSSLIDATKVAGTLQWDDGDSDAKSFFVTIATENLVAGFDRFVVHLTAITGNAILGASTATIIIKPNDKPSVPPDVITDDTTVQPDIVTDDTTVSPDVVTDDTTVSPDVVTDDTTVSPIPVIPVPTTPDSSSEGPKPSCSVLTGVINMVCNFEWQTAQDIDVGPRGNIANVVLENNIVNNSGWVSNAILTEDSQLIGGTLSGYIVNDGILADFEFRGAKITGGTLSGNISNLSPIDGFFSNVLLAADTLITGGKIADKISGDPLAPARLKNLTVASGAYLSNVIIDDNVTFEGEVTYGPGVQFVNKPESTPDIIIHGNVQADGQTLKNITICAECQVSKVVLEETITNLGKVSNITLAPGSHLTGGTLSRKITNNGTVTNIKLRGELIGGILSGNNKGSKKSIFRDVELAANTQVSGGNFQGDNSGDAQSPARLDSVTIMAGSRVANVIIGKNVTNNGTIADFEFQGQTLSGGTLAGSVVNTYGGTIQNVRLAPNVYIYGGNLRGKVIGDADAPALLENLIIPAGSYLENVRIGDDVTLAGDVTLGEGVQFVNEPVNNLVDEVEPPPMPTAITAYNDGTMELEYDAEFTGNIYANGEIQANHAMLSYADAELMRLSAGLLPSTEDARQPAELIMVAVHDDKNRGANLMLTPKGWITWDEEIASLEAVRNYPQLPDMLDISIYKGNLSDIAAELSFMSNGYLMTLTDTAGEYTFYIGYRLENGDLTFNGIEPIHFFVERAPAFCILYALHDGGLNNSQVITIDLSAGLKGDMQPLGPMRKGRDMEGLALHPSDPNLLFASAGDHAKVEGEKLNGYLYTIHRETGEMTVVGPTGFDKTAGLAFNPSDKTLWGWGRNERKDNQWTGLIKIDPETGKGTAVKQFDYKLHDMGGLAWSFEGDKLYASGDERLWVYDPETQTLEIACDYVDDGRIEGLDTQPNGFLLVGVDRRTSKSGNKRETSILAYDPVECKIVHKRVYEGLKYDDIESIVWPAGECNDSSWLSDH